MKGGAQARPWGAGGLWALCLLLSLLLHAGLSLLIEYMPRPPQGGLSAAPPRASRAVQVLRSSPRPEEEEKPAAEAEKAAPLPVVKTSADEAQRRPERPDFAGRHDQVASAEADAPQRHSDEPLPSMAGRESEERVTFDQERQDGALEHDREAGSQAAAPPPQPPSEGMEQPQPAAQGAPEGTPDPAADPQGEGREPAQPAPQETTASLTPHEAAEGGSLKLNELRTEGSLTLTPQQPPAPLGHEDGTAGAESPAAQAQPRTRRPVYDPSLAADAQEPGLRTYERRTRSTGRFVFGSRPSVNVSATARGRYEMEIYRRIARQWYAACDEHRGDIIPGSVTVSLRLTKSGSIDSMDLVRRKGASLIQQSFSFGAIRRASLPPMPAEVQAEVIGKLYEMILTFNFD